MCHIACSVNLCDRTPRAYMYDFPVTTLSVALGPKIFLSTHAFRSPHEFMCFPMTFKNAKLCEAHLALQSVSLIIIPNPFQLHQFAV